MTGTLPSLIYPNTSPASTLTDIILVQNTVNFNLHDRLIALGWNGTAVINTTVTVVSGVEVTSANVATPAFDTGALLPVGSTVVLNNRGAIVGKGATGSTSLAINASAGIGLSTSTPISVNNTGIIASGGYGGERFPVEIVSVFDPGAGSNGVYYHYGFGAGGGGGGAGYGAGGPRLTSSGHDRDYNNCHTGNPGSLLYGGLGGDGAISSAGSGSSGNKGGDLATSYVGRPPAVTGNANITWIAAGTIYGTLA